MNPMSNTPGRWRRILVPEALFTAGVYVLLLALFAVLRLLLWRNDGLARQIPAELLTKSFWVGLRFDLAVSSYLLIPFFLLLLVLRGRQRVWLLAGLAATVGGVIFSSLAEIEFYRELEFRFNTVVFEYLNHPRIVAGMAWEGYPVLRYLLVWAALFSLFTGACSWLYRRLLLPAPPVQGAQAILARTMGVTLMLAMMIFASRGGFAHEPLRWGDAFFSEEPFANDLALNGVFTLGRSVLQKASGKDRAWTGTLAADEASRLTRQMLLLPHETDLSSADHPILRQDTRSNDAAPLLLRRDPARPMNVVVILMESFAGRHTGALGAPGGITPAFDALSRQGILFERAFSNGTHTHQGVFASLASFPNLPGFEYLMKTMEAKQEFSGLPELLDRAGYQSVFLYNGLFSWDNKEGFFRQHGMDRFVGREDYVNPTFVDPVWGVSDYDVFMRANEEFKAMAANGPFFGAILTLSNHSPFNLPDPLPFARITTGDDMEPRLNSMRYADWALGEFFRQAQGEEWFQNTLFVLTGDHGFGTPPAITEMRLDRQHVPLLFYSPALDPAVIGRRTTVASQVDIGASVLGLLGLEVPHQSWGRNLFDPGLEDAGFAVVKPSGGEDMVALIAGDYVLVRESKGNTLLYRCDFGFPPRVELLPKGKATERRAAMLKQMQAYVETGLLSLRGRKLGVPEASDKVGRLEPKAY